MKKYIFISEFFLLLQLSLEIPDSFNWLNKITNYREPGSCGSNWSFSTLSLLESYYQLNKGKYIKLSEQMLLDCDTYDNGCNDGSVGNALKWIKKNGIMKDSDYAYKGVSGVCKKDPSKYIDMKVTGYTKLGSESSPADEEEMKKILYEQGPISIGINATPLTHYSSGIIDLDSDKCPPNEINHRGLIVGYGTINGIDFWLVKNSWGKPWGENGLLRIRRGKGVCGINYDAYIADVSFE